MNASLKINYHYYTTHHYEVQPDKREQQSQSMVTEPDEALLDFETQVIH
jgi:hypothetical protein